MLGFGKKDDDDDKLMAEIKALNEKIAGFEKQLNDSAAEVNELQKQLQQAQSRTQTLASSQQQIQETQALAKRLEQEVARMKSA